MNRQLSFNPWVWFSVFLAANLLISYFPLSLTAKIWIGLGGIFLPFLLAFWLHFEKKIKNQGSYPASDSSGFFESKDGISPPLLIFFLFALGFTRFYGLTSLPFWPIGDEGIDGILAIHQSQTWSWRLLWGQDFHEPLHVWSLGLFFKLFTPSFFSLRIFTALVSTAASGLAYWGARAYFSKRQSFLFCCLFSFCFWDLTLARSCITVILIPPLQCLCFGLLGRLLNPQLKAPSRRLAGAGLLVGSTLGFYSWANWIGVWLGLVGIWGTYLFFKKKQALLPVFIFIFTSLLLALPLIWIRLTPGGSSHIHNSFTLNLGKSLLLYLNGLFWNGNYSFPYGSNWGGFLNPILDSLIFLGMIHFLQTAKKPWLYAIPGVYLACLLPGILTGSVELYRVLPFLVAIIAAAILGIQSLLRAAHVKAAGAAIAVLLVLSVGLDFYNYLFRYCDIRLIPPRQQWRSVEYYHAYQILDALRQKDGPLYFFSDFNIDYDDKTLDVCAYPFNALQNPALSKTQPLWAALILTGDYTSYLLHRFPEMKYESLPSDDPQENGRHSLFLIPISKIPAPTLVHWKQANDIFQTINLEIKNKNPVTSWAAFGDELEGLRDQIDLSDPFLKALYFEKLAFFQVCASHFEQAGEFYEQAAKSGIKSRRFYDQADLCFQSTGEREKGLPLSPKPNDGSVKN